MSAKSIGLIFIRRNPMGIIRIKVVERKSMLDFLSFL
jgi:hypothetical protein